MLLWDAQLGEGHRDGEGHRQLVVLGTTPCTQPWGCVLPDAQCQAPWVSATSAFLFRPTTSLLSLLGCLRFPEPTSAIFGACVAFFRGRVRKITWCSPCLSSVPVGERRAAGDALPSQRGAVEC